MHLFSVAAVLLLLVVVTGIHAQSSLASLQTFERLREVVFNALRVKPTGRAKHMQILTTLDKVQVPEDSQRPFPCPTEGTRSPSRPSSVHRLRPGDIDVVGAMGDSLTASNGNEALNMFQVLVEDRGSSWSIGGEKTWREFLTLPNILKEFNPRLVGYSYNASLSHQRASQFNVAEAGAMSRDMPFQAKILRKRMRSDSRVDYDNDWKLVSLMIGPNDFCLDMCYEDTSQLPANHRLDLTRTLDFLRDNMPRTLVNLVAAPDLAIIMNFTGKSPMCHIINSMECPCMFGLAYRHRRQEFIDVMQKWQQVEVDVMYFYPVYVNLTPGDIAWPQANSDRYRTKDDFAVVLQPFPMQLSFPRKNKVTDYSYLSSDCFHFSQKANARAGNALWNNMLEPVGNKSMDWDQLFSRFLCPTEESPYIFTAGNSAAL